MKKEVDTKNSQSSRYVEIETTDSSATHQLPLTHEQQDTRATEVVKKSWRIGVVGIGKLGMPVALAMSLKGHDVMGYDVDPSRMQKSQFPHQEVGPNGEPSIE